MTWPKYLADQIIIGNPESDLAIVCGWTPKQTVERICKELGIEFAAIGNLYSARRGLTPLIRNLFLNPNIKSVGLVGQDLSGSLQTLNKVLNGAAFFNVEPEVENGHYIIDDGNGRISANIDIESLRSIPDTLGVIPDDLADNLRDQLKVVDECRMAGRSMAEVQPYDLRPITEFPEDEMISASMWPDRYAGHVVHSHHTIGAWLKALHRINRYGSVSPTQYGTQQQELYDVMTVIDSPMMPQDEIEQILKEDWPIPITAEDYAAYRKQILTAEKIDGIAYTYGTKIWFFMPSILEKLRNNPDDRSAIISLWGDQNYYTSKDNPCLTQLHFRKDTKGCLVMTASFRSHDYWNAYLMNVWALRELQSEVAGHLGMTLGSTVILSQSAHIYEDCWEAAEKLTGVALMDTRVNPYPHDVWDPRGQFIINLNEEKTEIHVSLVAPEEDGGYLLESWVGNRANRLGEKILRGQFLTDPAHALYLGRQLQRAEDHLHGDLPYRQI